jgi:uncharacterized protein (DUF2126 family)
VKIIIEPTDKFFMLGDVMVRAWKGVSAMGDQVTALVSAVQVEGELGDIPGLVSIPPPGPDEARRWAEEVMRRPR